MRIVAAELLVLSIVGTATTALADTNECSPKGYDICAFAKDAQAELAPSLPMRLNKNMTLYTVSAVGRRIVFSVVWDQTKSEVDERIAGAGSTFEKFTDAMDQMSRQIICGQDETAAFIRQGGIWEGNYRSADAVPIHIARIENCP